jgi:catechol 2,3-dioxygenase-like lactoylglutathione lyase family enzyme
MYVKPVYWRMHSSADLSVQFVGFWRFCDIEIADGLPLSANDWRSGRMASGRAIDHVVLTVRNLDRAAATYQKLGFTLTSRAMHEDRMGTSNRLAQFGGRNFIELLEVDRPEGLARHDFAASPPFFSFGDHNRLAVREREGLSMLVFAGDDARADNRKFSAAGLPTFAPFDFERYAKLPGTQVTVAFSLAFVQSPDMPKVAFFVCENRAQDYFWKPEYQSHANGATGIVAVYLSSPAPERDAVFVSKMFGGKVSSIAGGWNVACGPSQQLRVLTPRAIAERDSSVAGVEIGTPILAGIALATYSRRQLTPAAEANGMFIEWVPM